MHNLISYQRRRCSWWNDFGLWLWLNENRLVGFAEFGSITPEEFLRAFRRHGAVSGHPIDMHSIREEVYGAALMMTTPSVGRYQAFRIAIEPVMLRVLPTSPNTVRVAEPMPILL